MPSRLSDLRAFTRIEPQIATRARSYRLAGAGGTVGGRPIRRATARAGSRVDAPDLYRRLAATYAVIATDSHGSGSPSLQTKNLKIGVKLKHARKLSGLRLKTC